MFAPLEKIYKMIYYHTRAYLFLLCPLEVRAEQFQFITTGYIINWIHRTEWKTIMK